MKKIRADPRLISSLGVLGAFAVGHRFSKFKWKVQWKGGGNILPVLRGTNRRKCQRVLTSALGAAEPFFHSEKFGAENLEKQKDRNEPPSRQENQKQVRRLRSQFWPQINADERGLGGNA